ncbi:MAG: hypothetical protein JXA42_01380 [Anaerolineales bacterium]|nr:hypothetical protein [Anaerolineales bacterium]
MGEIIKGLITERIKIALLQLWLYYQIEECQVIGIKTPEDILQSLILFATNILEEIEFIETTQPEIFKTLINLFDISPDSGIEHSLLLIYHDLDKKSVLSDTEKIQFLVSYIERLIQEIGLEPSFSHAKKLLNIIDQLIAILARLAFKSEKYLDDRMNELLFDFDHVEDETGHRMIFEKIKKSLYPQSKKQS